MYFGPIMYELMRDGRFYALSYAKWYVLDKLCINLCAMGGFCSELCKM